MYLHLKLALRQIFKSRFFSFINILGLALGISVSTIILILVIHELKFDRYNKNLENIYRVEVGDWALMSPSFSTHLAEKFPEIDKTTRFSIYEFHDADVKWNDTYQKIGDFLLADSSVFDIFTYDFVEGNPAEALTTPYSVVLSESTAKAVFGDGDPMGQILKVNNSYDFVVTGVVKDQPFTSLPFEAIGSFSTVFKIKGRSDYTLFNFMNFQEYFLLKNGTDKDLFTQKINDYLLNLPDLDGFPYRAHLRPLKDIYFSNKVKYEGGSVHGNPEMLKILIAIAIFILVLAVINFINLTTARSGLRARETAVRKVYGASRSKIILHYLGESILISLLAFIFAAIIIELSLPVFSRLFDKQLSLSYLQSPFTIPIVISAILLTGIFSGLYPAFYMSNYNNLKVLKGELTRGRKGIRLRRYLIISQFVIAAGLIFATQVIHKQVSFMRNKDLGFNKNNIVCVDLPMKIRGSLNVFREKLLTHPQIQNVSFANALPGSIGWQESWQIDDKTYQFTYLPVDENYIDFMGLTLIKGRKFNADRMSDRDSMLIFNETALKEMGIKDPIGFARYHQGRHEQIIGVIKDFHYNSLHAPIAPLALVWSPYALSRAMIRIQPGTEQQTIKIIRQIYRTMAPESLFNYQFLDSSFDQLYKNDVRFGRLFNWFTVLSVIIAAMGLFGMVSFMTGSRRKEIAVRKVTGATVSDVVRLYLREFLIWVLIANIIALPVVTLGIDKWLSEFPYVTHTGFAFYLVTLAGSLFIAGITVLWHTLRAGFENPADILKYE